MDTQDIIADGKMDLLFSQLNQQFLNSCFRIPGPATLLSRCHHLRRQSDSDRGNMPPGDIFKPAGVGYTWVTRGQG
jgi:hypothetical protein